MSLSTSDLQKFREQLYMFFSKRKDAAMNLLDALTSDGKKYDSIVQLSNSLHFERKYSSITDAISDGLSDANWDKIRNLIFQKNCTNNKNQPYKFIIDCTSNSRAHSKTLSDRHITHAPNPAPGNKPICVGHQYSVMAVLPNEITAQNKHWLVPLSAERVHSSQKGNEIGIKQIIHSINELKLTDNMCISIGDSLYGTVQCRQTASQQDNLVHIFRLNSTRNVFSVPLQQECVKKGRKKEFGIKMNLNNIATYLPDYQSAQTQWVTSKGKEHTVSIKCWSDILLRGSRKFRSSKHPLNLVQIIVTNQKNESVYKKPLWLAVFGKRRNEIGLVDVYNNYSSRYDIEHFFRFGKRNLLMDSYQTPDVAHEELWWKFCTLAYVQLYMAKDLVKSTPQPWERYLRSYKIISENKNTTLTPSQAQRGFSDLLTVIGTPAKICIPRGKAPGRISGEKQETRMKQPIIFKAKKTPVKFKESILLGCNLAKDISNPQKINVLIDMVLSSLVNLKISPKKFSEIFINSS